ncbi:DUF5107 domain-containing protein [Agromyces albus]|uniref:DUF5107 domain-containing protein n=1 Tax=Agromyces albus TaxID=205332 RepID=A0A4Q2KXM8_9MICO|nr:DUF5107 domain-containing protein [Agromyces albus]RXZ68632.1 DUF5107 domain-containing protein [Agromyces albus]
MLDVETPAQSRIALPPVPAALAGDRVAAWSEPVLIDSYLPGQPDAYPAFLDSRVYQGSSGRVFPLPFHERIAQDKTPHLWQAVHLENEWLRLMILPELGGRIHVAYDKVAKYDIFYRNNVIKPALVGLAGPWISGGVEFNWPQHHRPATFLPTDVEIEWEEDGSITVWCSDHDPFARMKGMHGIRLRPDSSLIEARVRLFNRTEVPQTFLWWANVAAAVNDGYQSFFPTDVTTVADHARRATTTFPEAGRYYGVDYRARADADHPDGDRLDWYRNIPVPTSYMVLSTEDEFFGGYDHGRDAGFVHWASGGVSPGKKQWTWGNDEFGWAWERNLTDGDGPYIELMAGVFTDNQPDFAWLAPGETKTFSQYWYPIQKIGPVQQATLRAAASLRGGTIGVVVTSAVRARILLTDNAGATLFDTTADLAPGSPFAATHSAARSEALTLTVTEGDDVLVSIAPRVQREQIRSAAVAPPRPADVGSVDELYLIGRYLEQYRHATRHPEQYWLEAIARDARHVGARTALGAREYAAGNFEASVEHLSLAVARNTAWTPTPTSGEAHYRLGLGLMRLGRDREAEAMLQRAAWDVAWRGAAWWALARLYGRRGDWAAALDRAEAVASADPDHNQAICLRARILRELGRVGSVEVVLERDPLDQWARDLAGLELTRDAPTLLDVAIEYAGAGFPLDSLRLLDAADAVLDDQAVGQVAVGPLVAYHRALLLDLLGRSGAAQQERVRAKGLDTTNCLPSRLEDVAALEAAGEEATALAQLGHWYYDRGRRSDAIAAWRRSLELAPDRKTATIVHRNLGVAAYNVDRDPFEARMHYEAAIALTPRDPKLWFEFDQLAARSGETPATRLARLEAEPDMVAARDDLSVSFANLLIDAGRAAEARELLAQRRFQPWEGGEGQVLGAWERAALAVAADLVGAGDAERAVELLISALVPPAELGEARHPLANASAIHLALGDALIAAGDESGARTHWRVAADSAGDFTGMRDRSYSLRTAHSVLALRRLGDDARASELTRELAEYTEELAVEPAEIDFFATSLPTMLLFVDDPQEVRDLEVRELRAQLAHLRPKQTGQAASMPSSSDGSEADREHQEKG